MNALRACELGRSFDGEYERIADIPLEGLRPDGEVAVTGLHGGWFALWCDWGTFHIVPVADTILHHVAEGDDCICVPVLREVENGWWMASHSSLDGRELSE